MPTRETRGNPQKNRDRKIYFRMSAYVSESIRVFEDLVDARVCFQSVLEHVNNLESPQTLQRQLAAIPDATTSQAAVGSLVLELLDAQLCSMPGKWRASKNEISDLWSEIFAPMNLSVFSWTLAEAEKWRQSTRILDLKTLEAPFSEQIDYLLPTKLAKFTKDPENFDDKIFYASLLKDSLATRNTLKNGRAKAVRASKGRKLTAKIYNKLVGFTNPRRRTSRQDTSNEDVDVLVNSLFQ